MISFYPISLHSTIQITKNYYIHVTTLYFTNFYQSEYVFPGYISKIHISTSICIWTKHFIYNGRSEIKYQLKKNRQIRQINTQQGKDKLSEHSGHTEMHGIWC